MRWLERQWYQSSYTWVTFLLLPFSWVFRLIILARYFLYRFGLKKIIHLPVPVIVVGNITVGGTGKTPFVIWLANHLQKYGFKPGIVTRGVGGENKVEIINVDLYSQPIVVGDEAILLFQSTHCPVVVGRDRVRAAHRLMSQGECNVIIADDGLQHYRLGRHIEIAMVDGERQFGNKKLLPAGPLREPMTRLRGVNFVVTQGKLTTDYSMQLRGELLCSLKNPQQTQPLKNFAGQSVHVIAAIGNPTRFFDALRKQNIHVIEHWFPDHYLFQASDIIFSDNLPVIMTEKDAVKCVGLGDVRHWYLPVKAKVSAGLAEKLLFLLKGEQRKLHTSHKKSMSIE